MIKKCKCGYMYETTWQLGESHRRNRDDEGPWENHIPKFNMELKIVQTYLYKRMKEEKLTNGDKPRIQFIQQEIDYAHKRIQEE